MGQRIVLVLALSLTLVFAGCGGGDDAPVQTAGDAPPPAAEAPRQSVVDDDEGAAVSVDFLQIPYGETEDDLLYGHFVYPSNMVEPLPAVIVVHDWWGLNDVVREEAARIAAKGYMVLAIDMFRGKTAASTPDASALARELLDEPGFAELNIRSAHAFLTEGAGAPAVATLGWSLGGYWALEATRFMPDTFAAAVVFYGQPDSDPDAVSAVSAPVLGLYGGSDRSIPAADVRALRDQARELEKSFEIVIYPDANHGFANPEDPRYDRDAATQAWRRVAEFLRQYLGSA